MSAVNLLSRLREFEIKSGVGVYELGGEVHRVEAGWTVAGLTHRTCTGNEEDVADGSSSGMDQLLAGLGTLLSRGLDSLLKRKPASGDGDAASAVMPVTVGLRANVVTFQSEVAQDQALPSAAAPDRDESSPDRSSRKAGTVLSDSMTVSVGKQTLSLTGKVRYGELEELEQTTGLAPTDPHRYEPEPWAVWRASAHYAPFKPKNGIHLRYVLGDQAGLAILGTPKHPVAWQVLSWDEDGKEAAVLQAYHLLSVHAARRLHLTGINHIAIQGEDDLDGDWDSVEEAIGQPILDVDGPSYGPELVAFGLALGAMEGRADTLNLARTLQEKPSLLAMVPWGEAGFLVSLFLCMFLVLSDHASGVRQQLNAINKENAAVTWARGINKAQLNAEQNKLTAQVNPLQRYLDRELHFSQAITAIGQELPDSTWLDSISGGDLIWEKNANKMLGQRYVQVQAGAPSARKGLAPPEIDHAVRGLERNEYLKEVLPRVKLTDVNWRQQGGQGYTVFSVLVLPDK